MSSHNRAGTESHGLGSLDEGMTLILDSASEGGRIEQFGHDAPSDLDEVETALLAGCNPSPAPATRRVAC
jgi:hypothetical protein